MKRDRALLWFQYAVMGSPALVVAVSWRAPEVPSSLQARVDAVASVMGLLQHNVGKSRKIFGKSDLAPFSPDPMSVYALGRPRALDRSLADGRVVRL